MITDPQSARILSAITTTPAEAIARAALDEAADFVESKDGYDSIGGEHPLVSGIRALKGKP